MENLFAFSSSTYFLLVSLFMIVILILTDSFLRRKRIFKKIDEDGLLDLPGPKPWPIIGSLHLLGGYKVPYEAFNVLAQHYGKVFQMSLGSVNCVVVNGLDNIREVLMAKSTHFDGRPNFKRYHQLFCGDKENSLAFCNWSDVQKTRREMLRAHTFPRAFTNRFHLLDSIIGNELNIVKESIDTNPNQEIQFKPLLLSACANVFTSYFCSKRFSTDNRDFQKMVLNFDNIFYEVNQGYAADFITWLQPFHGRHLSQIGQWSHEIRQFMLTSVIGNRLDSWTEDQEQNDYVDSLIHHVKGEVQPAMSWDTALFALEDIVGGHAAVANFMVKVLGFIAKLPDVQHKIQEEVDSATMKTRDVTLADRGVMPYTEAVILEVIRLIASPIVPHVANQDSSIAGFRVEKDTLIFLNNYDLSMSSELWSAPETFQPERFVSAEGRLVKPEHFLPFGGGRRSCMGYKMVQLICFSTLASLLQSYHIVPAANYEVPIGSLALPYKTFEFKFEKR